MTKKRIRRLREANQPIGDCDMFGEKTTSKWAELYQRIHAPSQRITETERLAVWQKYAQLNDINPDAPRPDGDHD